MSMFERLNAIRLSTGLSRKDFGDSINTSHKTIEGIENDGKVPRGDTLERIVNRYPQYALWLLTGSAISVLPQINPNSKIEDQANIVDSSDPRYIENILFNKKFIVHGNITFIQNIDKLDYLCVLITLDQSMLRRHCSDKYNRGSILLKSGYLNFNNSDGGFSELAKFRDSLKNINADLVSRSSIKGLDDSLFNVLENSESLKISDLKDVQISNILSSFNEWKNKVVN